MTGTQSINRALHILKAFDDHNPRWELSALVEAVGLNKTTVFRILAALEAEGLIEKTDTGEYRLGSEMIAMGGRAARANPLREAASPHLKALTRATGETTTLEIIRRDTDGAAYMLVIDEVLGKHLVGITQYIGTRLPVHATSTGKVILAYLTDDARADLLPPDLQPLTAHTHQSPDAFIAALQTAYTNGYALVVGELEEGVVAVGAPIFNADGYPIAALSLVGPSVRFTRSRAAELAPQVIATAHRISHDIGYRQPIHEN
jgi:IclR family acetate operon transcriptional repressor